MEEEMLMGDAEAGTVEDGALSNAVEVVSEVAEGTMDEALAADIPLVEDVAETVVTDVLTVECVGCQETAEALYLVQDAMERELTVLHQINGYLMLVMFKIGRAHV